MSDTTIVNSSPVGRHLDSLGEGKPASYLMFNHKKVELVAKITIGRDTDNDVVVQPFAVDGGGVRHSRSGFHGTRLDLQPLVIAVTDLCGKCCDQSGDIALAECDVLRQSLSVHRAAGGHIVRCVKVHGYADGLVAALGLDDEHQVTVGVVGILDDVITTDATATATGDCVKRCAVPSVERVVGKVDV